MCIAQFNLYLVVLVVAILPITRPAIASHNLARFNPRINPGIPGLSKLNPEIPGLAKRSGIPFPRCYLLLHILFLLLGLGSVLGLGFRVSVRLRCHLANKVSVKCVYWSGE